MKFLVLFSLFIITVNAIDLDVVYEWKELSYRWPNETFKNESIANGKYIAANIAPLGFGVWRNKVFLTIPRWFNGVPASVVYFDTNSTNTSSPDVIAYPSWENHDIDNFSSETIVNSVRLTIDSCNRMWLVDSGTTDFNEDSIKTIGPAAIIVIDLETDKIVRRYELKSTDQSSNSFFSTVIIDVDTDSCANSYAYIPDLGTPGLIVYSYAQNDSWKFSHNFLGLEPLLGNFWFHGINFQYNDGVFGGALAPIDDDGYRTFYFHAFVSHHEFSVNTRTLQNKSLASNNNYYLWKHEGYKGERSNSLISEFDETTNTLITGLPKLDAVGCWNPKLDLHPETFHLVAQDSDIIRFPTDLRIDTDRNLWVFTTNLPVFQFSTLNFSETNFRLTKNSVDDVIAGTVCEV